ncbi:GFA family protein [Mesorhizobium australicum]|uniref:GFA family protein n=1 Tax=Mesorhizobium australicum TaxID=536018 RepID=UPI00333C4D89
MRELAPAGHRNRRGRPTFSPDERSCPHGIGEPAETQAHRTGAKVELNGGCLCGRIRFNVTSEPRVHYCHCDMCRRATGSAFAVLAWVPSPDLTWIDATPAYRRSSPIAQRGFCPACGSPLTLAYDVSPGEIALHVGTFDDPARLEPRYNYGSGQRLGWVCCGVDLPRRETEERW